MNLSEILREQHQTVDPPTRATRVVWGTIKFYYPFRKKSPLKHP